MQTMARRVVSTDDVIRGGCRYFLRHGTVEMDALARSMAISRATLYRVAHSRDQLLGDVLWRLGERMLAAARRERTQSGVDGVLEITREFLVRLQSAEPYQRFLSREQQTAARVLFTEAGGVHKRAVAAQKEILLETACECRWRSAKVDDLAYLYVRLVESVLYAEMFTGRPPDIELGERAARSLLETYE